MDENQIAAQVAQNIPSEEPAPEPVQVIDETPKPSAFETDVELTDPAIGLRIADFFNLSSTDRFSAERQGQLRALYRWGAEQAGSTGRGDVMQKLQVLERELGVTYKPNRLEIMSRWVKLDNQANAIRKEMEAWRG